MNASDKDLLDRIEAVVKELNSITALAAKNGINVEFEVLEHRDIMSSTQVVTYKAFRRLA